MWICALAGKSTVNRLEWAAQDGEPDERYRRIEADAAAIDRFFVETFLGSQRRAPRQIGLEICPRTADAGQLIQVNQMRLWFASLAHTLLRELRHLALAGTEMAHARCSTIQLKRLKIGALVQVTTRKVWVRFATAYPYQARFETVVLQLPGVGTTLGWANPPHSTTSRSTQEEVSANQPFRPPIPRRK